ncbi:MAG: IS1595 family transposase, partial [Acidimicrobiales bacterium]
MAGVDYPGTWQAFEAWFPDDDACRRYLVGLRWPEGFVCPSCDGLDAWETSRGLFMCRGCGRQTSVTAGTIFHRIRSPLRTWFAAVWFVCSQKNGVSALGLQRVLGFGSYETAWAWLHKLRRAMVRSDRDRLGGPGVAVELDETFIGGRSPGGLRARYETKSEIVIAVERRHPKGLGRVRMHSLDSADRKSEIFAFATEVIEPGTVLYTDGANTYDGLAATIDATHERIELVHSTEPAHVV